MTYTGPIYLAIVGIAVSAGAAGGFTFFALGWLIDWWFDRRAEPGPIEAAADGIEPVGATAAAAADYDQAWARQGKVPVPPVGKP